MSQQRLSLSDQVRRAVDSSALSRYRICKMIGLSQGAFSRFMHHTGGLSLTTLDRLADVLGLRVVADKKEGKS